MTREATDQNLTLLLAAVMGPEAAFEAVERLDAGAVRLDETLPTNMHGQREVFEKMGVSFLFDLWWLHTRPDFVAPTGVRLVEGLLRNVAAYSLLDPTSVSASLRIFATRQTPEEMVACAPRDLQRFIPVALWTQCWPVQIGEMAALAVSTALRSAEEVERHRGHGS